MAYTTINKSTSQFNTKLYTGNGGTQSITGVNFRPDWLWIKSRGSTGNHRTHDVVRGVDKQIYPNLSNAEYTYSPNTGVTSFDSDGFSLGSDGGQNANTETYVSWNWKANGAGSANTDGSINSTVSVNTTAGFSIVKWTGNGVAGASIGHGLGVVPKMIIVKRLNDTANWTVYHATLGNTHRLELNNETASTSDAGAWNNQTPTTTVFYTGNNLTVGNNGSTYVAYCFAEKTGYSKFGSYTGDGTTDNAFIYTGFKPTFFMTKRYSDTARWVIWDAVRDPYNNLGRLIYGNEDSAEGGYTVYLDFMSNGIKILDGNSKWGANGSNYIYMAFGQSLVGSNNVPCTAR